MADRFHSLLLPQGWLGFVRYMVVENLRRQYARTRIGPLWIVITQFVMIFGIALVFYSVFDRELTDFLPFISASILSWNMMAPAISNAPNVFVNNAPLIQSFRLPAGIFPLQTTLNSMVLFLNGLVVHIIVMLWLGKSIAAMPLLFPAMLVVGLVLYPLIAILGIAGSRLRDLGPLVGSVMYMAFLITPIIWERDFLADGARWIVDYNPLYHLIEIMRRPMLGQIPAMEHVVISCSMALIALAVGELVFRRLSRPLPFWV